jgi:hypothetical protein
VSQTSIDPGQLRVFVYDHIVARGRPPLSGQVAEQFGVSPEDALRAIREVKIGKTILPHPETGEIWMAGPFASSPSDYEVRGRDVRWWANCGWDMLGVAQLVGEPVRIDTRCGCCDAPISIDADAASDPVDAGHVVHFLVPARRWYDDIGFT